MPWLRGSSSKWLSHPRINTTLPACGWCAAAAKASQIFSFGLQDGQQHSSGATPTRHLTCLDRFCPRPQPRFLPLNNNIARLRDPRPQNAWPKRCPRHGPPLLAAWIRWSRFSSGLARQAQALLLVRHWVARASSQWTFARLAESRTTQPECALADVRRRSLMREQHTSPPARRCLSG